jgi:hypothetical protein
MYDVQKHPMHTTIQHHDISVPQANVPMNKLPKTAWGTEMSSEKEGLQQCEH